jgi:mannonate dehydratase
MRREEIMDRRHFMASCGTAITLAGLGEGTALGDEVKKLPAKVRMHLGCQRGPTSPEMLDYFKRHGVEAICGYPQVPPDRAYWTRDDLQRTRDLCEKHGVALEMVALPLLASSHIDREKQAAILLGREVGYPYMVMPDHMPGHADDPRGLQAFAYGYGYIKGVLQAVRRTAE